MNESPSIAVVFDGAQAPEKIRARWWHYVAAFFWNLYRKPLVWKRQRELLKMFTLIKESMDRTLLPALWERRKTCTACYNAYLSLKPQVFLSQIELILKRMACEDHAALFHSFAVTWEPEFRKSEQLARWINGL